MNKIQLFIFSVLLILAPPLVSNAQRFGIKAGYNFSKLGYDGLGKDIYSSASDIRTSATFGGYVNFKLFPLIFLQLEGNYETKGVKYSNPPLPYFNASFDGIYNEHLDYLSIPVLLRFNIIAFQIEAGPYFAFLLKAEETKKGFQKIPNADGGWIEQYFDKVYDLKPITKGTDIGLTAGVGVSYSIGPMQISGGARYNYGFTNILKEPIINDNGEVWIDSKKNRNFYIYIGLGIHI